MAVAVDLIRRMKARELDAEIGLNVEVQDADMCASCLLACQQDCDAASSAASPHCFAAQRCMRECFCTGSDSVKCLLLQSGLGSWACGPSVSVQH